MSGEPSYAPKSSIGRWLDTRLPVPRMVHDQFIAYPVPRNLNDAYCFAFGLIVMPLLGPIETPHRLPNSITEAVLEKRR
ncbi:hypothetical protein [Mesorhizobium sp. CN2-181]|uniref:hypothetical protein n=1 Tax=Mesorhizobium yinganensis TaxID=3157707 RepID=UPI0032B82ACE